MTDEEVEAYWRQVWPRDQVLRDAARFHYLRPGQLTYLGFFEVRQAMAGEEHKPFHAFLLPEGAVTYLSYHRHVLTTERSRFDALVRDANPLLQLALAAQR